MNASLVTVRYVYNNNVVLAIEPGGMEVVLLGKGLGFRRRPGDRVDPTGAQRFVPDRRYRATRVAELLSGATVEQAELARQIVTLAHTELGLAVSQSLVLPVLDHLAYAVRRARSGVTIDFPLRWEVGQLYPAEAAVGRRVVAMINRSLGVELQPDEWVAFALHFINQQWAGGDLGRTVTMTETIMKSFELLHELWSTPIDQDAMSAARFVTHIRYLFARVEQGRQLPSARIDVMASVRGTWPEAAVAAEQLSRLIGDALGHALTPEETAYLALHTSRLYADLHELPGPGRPE